MGKAKHAVVSREEWLAARTKFLAKEKQFTRLRDELSQERRALPWEKVDKPYAFDGPRGKETLADLFGDKSQLVIYHFMFSPDWEEGCPSCSFYADHTPDLRHLESRNTSYAAISRAPIAKIEAFKKRMGWTFPWYSSFGTDFNYDFHVSLDEAVMPVEYNYTDKATLEKKGLDYATKGEQPGMSAFLRDGEDIFRTYSAYARGIEKFLGTYLMLDMTRLGRGDGAKPGLGFVHHDKYEEITA
jgi:predicted dithiol-disulfide oxidoreductase (DUF899 family)